MVVYGRVLLPGPGGSGREKVGNLEFAPLPILGKGNADNQAGNTSVTGNEASGNFLGSEGDFLDSFDITVVQGAGIVDEWLDDQFVLEAFAMRVVRD